MKALGIFGTPKWASRKQVYTYRGGLNKLTTRRYSPTPSSRKRLARLCKAMKPEVINDGKNLRFVIIREAK